MARTSAPPLSRKLADGYRRAGAAGASVLLAVSGGADSTALAIASAELARPLGLRLAIASLDHGFRAEAAGEVRAVAALAARLGLPFRTRALGLPPGPAAEERARTAREAALEEIRGELAFELVATAHTADDQAETVLMRLGRGAGAKGAAGILLRRGRFIRPLLSAARAEVLAFLGARGERFAVDPMNADPAFLRSRIRASALPALAAAVGPHAVERLAAFARASARDESFLGGLANSAAERLRLSGGGLDAAGLRALDPSIRVRVLGLLLEGAGAAVTSDLLDAADRAACAGRSLGLGRAVELRCAGGVVRCARRAKVQGGAALLELGGQVAHRASGLTVSLLDRPPGGTGLVMPVRAEVPLPLSVRSRLPGDRLRGAGRKLQDALVDRKVPREARDRIAVIADARGDILWVVGVWPARPRPISGALFLCARPLDSERAEER